MFDLDWGELVVIGIVALIAIGPKELPTVLRTLGQWMGKVRRMATEFQGQFQEAMREAEMADLQEAGRRYCTARSASFTNIDPLADAQKDIERVGRRRRQAAGAAVERAGRPRRQASRRRRCRKQTCRCRQSTCRCRKLPPPVDRRRFRRRRTAGRTEGREQAGSGA